MRDGSGLKSNNSPGSEGRDQILDIFEGLASKSPWQIECGIWDRERS